MKGPQTRAAPAGPLQVREREDGFVIHEGPHPLRTPAGAELSVPTLALAEAIIKERCTATAATPLQKLAWTAIDRVAPQRARIEGELLRYVPSDLTCYRAEPGSSLAERQAMIWDPYLAWIEKFFGARMRVSAGVAPCMQEPECEMAIARALVEEDIFVLTALHVAAALLGSLVLALALRHGRCDIDGAWIAARVDEDWQQDRWGTDGEAARRAETLKKALCEADRFLRLSTAA